MGFTQVRVTNYDSDILEIEIIYTQSVLYMEILFDGNNRI